MSFKKIKKLVAQLLIVAFIVPNISAKAITNNPGSAIEEKSTDEVTNSITSSVQSSQDNGGEEDQKKETDNGEELLNNEKDSTKDNEAQNSTSNDSSEEKTSTEQINTESTTKVEESKEDSATLNNTTSINNETSIKEEVKKEESTNTLKGTKYTKVKEVNPSLRSYSVISSVSLEREEFKLKQEALENLEVLQPMTDKNYELTIANSDGSYEFVEAYDELDEAVSAAKSLDPSTKENQDPAVINYSGQVVYSTNQMARVIKYSNNSVISGTVNMHTDSSLQNAFTYVNPGYMDDAPVLDMSGTSAKVMINGYEGWINNNTASGTYDMRVVPLSQAKNPSYYTVKNGELVHFISYDLTGVTGYEKILGKAPFFLKEGVRYLSYDGKYFYQYNHNSDTDIANKLDILIKDYRSGVRSNSVNSGSPYYIYYLNLPFRSQTVYSAEELDRYINNNTQPGSKLRGLGQAFKEAENVYGVNALLALGVSINESAYGMSTIAQTKNNLFGLKAYDSAPGESADNFATPKDSVVDFTKNYISRGYSDPADWRYFGGFLGNKNRGTNVKYASDPFWGEKATSFAYEIDKYLSGGNSNLKDTNSKQIGVATSNTSVIKKDGTLLYNVTNDTSQYGAYINTPFVVSNLQQVTINGKSYYEIHPERNTPIGVGGPDNKYHGSYNWNDRGYILASNVSMTNEYLPPIEVKSGLNRYSTAVELSKSSFTSADTIVISNGYAIPDGLAATPIASYYKGPLLLVEKSSIPSETQNEIKRLKAKNVIIVGGTGVVTPAVESQLRNLGITKITRLGGVNRYETALQVAKYIDQNLYDVENLVIANGYGEADALSIAPVSGRDRMPIVLVEPNSIPSSVNSWLKSENLNTAYLIGGTGVLSNNVLNQVNSMTKKDITGNRLGGANRYETNAKVIERFYGNVLNKVYVTEGLELADALTSGPVAAVNESPVVIAEAQLTSTQKTVLDKKTANSIVQVGGVVSKTVINNLRQLLAVAQ
ncbi:cell wall-binding repeat-containing protein [Clostridium sp. DSM 100503]|uniref:cell wall-binding repeat-containing protein n=1 Tax=Clostridium sp. DSM 100503 TaxID=2963282 RepID=UPI002149FD54|nr:cell wall-binding repeat-containing protein [Clostridium sp. DSM 100503]MCR1950676.1 cell wall-binding repeat-containing protein [Clostridium sp. DSM 100503]